MKIIVILSGIILLLYVSYRTYRISTQDDGLDVLIKKGAVILDVRTQGEYNTGHIEGSVNMSLRTLRERYVELDTSKIYITCCSHGLRSVKAESLLKERGFQHVYNGGSWVDLQKIISAK